MSDRFCVCTCVSVFVSLSVCVSVCLTGSLRELTRLVVQSNQLTALPWQIGLVCFFSFGMSETTPFKFVFAIDGSKYSRN